MRKAAMWTVAVAIVVGTLVAPAAPAQAFDERTCNSYFGATRIESVDKIQIDTGSDVVDFGDHPHWGGSPRETAVICWRTNGDLAIYGRVFADSYQDRFVEAHVAFLYPNGTAAHQMGKGLTGSYAESEYLGTSAAHSTPLTKLGNRSNATAPAVGPYWTNCVANCASSDAIKCRTTARARAHPRSCTR